jgi:hypothetical protein
MSDVDARDQGAEDVPVPDQAQTEEKDSGVLSPGSTATGAGTTEADVSDGREQKLPRVD